ncbi:MAG TPA: type II secretion system secretin GspD, partial [Synergistaceae bacterium]|nr:type II secretion system secretin GspD [Synergistaceae bacterium]
MRKKRSFIAACLGFFLVSILFWGGLFPCFEKCGAEESEMDLVQAARLMRESGQVQFNFKDLDILLFVRFMSELLQENILVDPGVKGTITIVSTRPISVEDSRQVMLSALQMNGLSLQSEGGYSKVRSANTGPSTENIIRKGRMGPGYGEEYIVQIVPLDYTSTAHVQEALRSVIGKEIGIFPVDSGRGVILSGRATTVQNALGVINALDSADSVRKVYVLPLEHTNPPYLAEYLNKLVSAKTPEFEGVFALGLDKDTKIIVVADNYGIDAVRRFVKAFDVKSEKDETPFHIYKLQNSDATEVAKQLSQIIGVAVSLTPDKKGELPTTVVADVPTNSLIFAAPPEQYESFVKIIQQLDIQPKQVMLRGLIAEVSLTRLNDAGIDWATWGGKVFGDGVLAGNIQLGESGVPSEFLSWFNDISKTEVEDDDGNITTTYETQGLMYAYVRLLNKYNAINVLSMPRLLCTDNKESTLMVGENIPQLKASTADNTNPGSVANSYEYKDTGLILKVTPHVRGGKLVALDIEQRVEDVLTAMTSSTPVTSKREIKTSVLVRDGQTDILGGIMKETEKSLKNRVPGLSYIPLIRN